MGDIMKYHYAPPRAEVFENRLLTSICRNDPVYGQILTHDIRLVRCKKCLKKLKKLATQ